MLIINADDFGLSASVNKAVLAAIKRGLVSSATVMPTMPDFDEACALAREEGLGEHVGTHLVLTAGEPLTTTMRLCRRFCDTDGAFLQRRATGRILRLSSEERDAVIAELRAQVEACRAHGLPVTHLDSHQHVHTEFGLGPIVIAVARALRVPYVRLARTSRRDVRLTVRVNRAVYNRLVRRAGMAATRYFGDIDDYRRLREVRAEGLHDFELMTHPQLDARGRVVDIHCSQAGLELEQILADVVGIEGAVSFAGVRYRRLFDH